MADSGKLTFVKPSSKACLSFEGGPQIMGNLEQFRSSNNNNLWVDDSNVWKHKIEIKIQTISVSVII